MHDEAFYSSDRKDVKAILSLSPRKMRTEV